MKQSTASRHDSGQAVRLPRVVTDVLRTPGAPLDVSSRSFFESRFQHDFARLPAMRPQALAVGAPADAFEREADRFANGIATARADASRGVSLAHVRVHTGPDAATAARALHARAFTAGAHVVFGENEYAPDTTRGRHLMAHELAHVQQQSEHGPRIQRAETDDDPNAVPCDETLADGAEKLNAEVNARLNVARKKAALHAGNRLQVVEAARYELTKQATLLRFLGMDIGIGTYTDVEDWAENNLPARGGGWPFVVPDTVGATVVEPNVGTRYQGTSRLAMQVHLAPVVKLNGVCCGTDKIGHFFQQGYQYYRITQPAILGGFGQKPEVAEAWGESMEGRIGANRSTSARQWVSAASKKPEDDAAITGQKQGDYGLKETGVFSNADLAANKAGLQFWRDLFVTPALTFDIAKYITKNWNETVAGNIYAPDVAERVRAYRGALGPKDKEAKTE